MIAASDAACPSLTAAREEDAVTLRFVRPGAAGLPESAALADFDGQAGRVLAVAQEGRREVLFGLGAGPVAAMVVRALPSKLAPGDYRVDDAAGLGLHEVALAWALGARGFRAF
ncbi:MAG: hypothetical protein INR64_01335, partial [Caulobacteraceae bacterium]|nr:hypothetical protein [Caulobacter sp.]